jgi:Ice-binding-like
MIHEPSRSVVAHRVTPCRPTLATPIVARRCRRALGLLSLALLLTVAFATSAQAQTVGLGTADSFSVLAGSTVTNTGPTVINGDLGLSPGTAVTGFPPGIVNGTIHATDAVALQAQNDLTTAYNDAAGRPSSATVSGDLAGRTLSPGVYSSASSLGLSGDLTLDAQGDPSAVFVFQAGSTLTTGSGSRVLLQNGAQACNVFWQVGSSATIGTATAFTGNILALTSISLTTGATVDGRALARNGAVTMDTNVVTRSACAAGDGSSDGGSGGGGDGSGSGGSGGGGDLSTGAPVGPIPGVTTGTSTNVCPDSGRLVNARLRGRVRPGTAASTYYFQFGTTTSYGRQTRSGRAAANARPFTARATARRLRPATTYHYRIVGVSGGQRTFGADRTFRTRSREACSPTRPARPPRNSPPGLTG